MPIALVPNVLFMAVLKIQSLYPTVSGLKLLPDEDKLFLTYRSPDKFSTGEMPQERFTIAPSSELL